MVTSHQPAARVVASIAVLVLLVAAVLINSQSAEAQTSWTPLTNLATLPGAPQLSDLSGATMSDDGNLWSIDNKLDDVTAWSPAGSGWSFQQSWDLSPHGVSDAEALTWISSDSSGTHRVAVVDEATNRIFLFAFSSTATVERIILSSGSSISGPGSKQPQVTASKRLPGPTMRPPRLLKSSTPVTKKALHCCASRYQPDQPNRPRFK